MNILTAEHNLPIKLKKHQFSDICLYEFVPCFSVEELIPVVCPNIFLYKL